MKIRPRWETIAARLVWKLNDLIVCATYSIVRWMPNECIVERFILAIKIKTTRPLFWLTVPFLLTSCSVPRSHVESTVSLEAERITTLSSVTRPLSMMTVATAASGAFVLQEGNGTQWLLLSSSWIPPCSVPNRCLLLHESAIETALSLRGVCVRKSNLSSCDRYKHRDRNNVGPCGKFSSQRNCKWWNIVL